MFLFLFSAIAVLYLCPQLTVVIIDLVNLELILETSLGTQCYSLHEYLP